MRKRIGFYLPNGKTISFILIMLQILTHILVELWQVRDDEQPTSNSGDLSLFLELRVLIMLHILTRIHNTYF